MRAVRIFASVYQRNQCGMDGGAIAYFGLLSLVPFLIVGASVVGFLLLEFSEGDSASAYDLMATHVTQFLPFLEKDLALRLREIVANREVTGVLGLVFLMIAAGRFFAALDHAIGKILRDPSDTRRFWLARLLAVTFVPVILIVVALLQNLWVFAAALASNLPGGVVIDFVKNSPFLPYLISFFTLGGGFVVLVYWFGSRSIRFRHAASGAVVFVALWMVAQFGFAFFLEKISKLSLIYGSLTGLVVLVVWVYYAATILLFSCCVVRTMALLRDHKEGETEGDAAAA